MYIYILYIYRTFNGELPSTSNIHNFWRLYFNSWHRTPGTLMILGLEKQTWASHVARSDHFLQVFPFLQSQLHSVLSVLGFYPLELHIPSHPPRFCLGHRNNFFTCAAGRRHVTSACCYIRDVLCLEKVLKLTNHERMLGMLPWPYKDKLHTYNLSPSTNSFKTSTTGLGSFRRMVVNSWNPNDLYFWRSTPKDKAELPIKTRGPIWVPGSLYVNFTRRAKAEETGKP